MSFQRRKPYFLSLFVAIFCFLGLTSLERRANATRAQEMLGYARGQFIDRHGTPLARTVVDAARGPQRRYFAPDAAHVIGFRDPAGRWHGMEQRFNAELQPQTSTAGWKSLWTRVQGQVPAGTNVRLSLDTGLQRVADNALGAGPGAVVALDPRSGDVLALISKPACLAGQLSVARGYRACAANPGHPLLDRATSRPVAPGSAFKIVTLMAALERRTVHLGEIFSGQDIFGPSPYFDNSAYPSNVTRTDLSALTLEQALAFSDNFTFAHIGLSVGSAALLKIARRLYIDRHIPFDLSTAVSTVAGGRNTLSRSELARASFGSPVDELTPLQMAMVAAAAANDGVLMRPRLVLDVETPHGRVVRRYPSRALGRVVSSRTARDVATAMRFVVDFGSGQRAQISGIAVAGKTGTADSGARKPNAWFIAFAPAQNPIIAVAVLRETTGEGAEYAAPIARRLLVAALRSHGSRSR